MDAEGKSIYRMVVAPTQVNKITQPVFSTVPLDVTQHQRALGGSKFLGSPEKDLVVLHLYQHEPELDQVSCCLQEKYFYCKIKNDIEFQDPVLSSPLIFEQPTKQPTGVSSVQPSAQPTSQPSNQPTNRPSR